VNKATLRMLNSTEAELLREAETARLRQLDEDELVELHTQIRRARNKYSKLYRRRSSAQVKADRGRGRASKSHQRTLAKAEVFEDALARVSRHLARAARARADELRTERVAAARAQKAARGAASGKETAKGSAGTTAKGKGKATGKQAARKKARTPASKRAAASTRAATRRKQAKRDAR
jgi:hypothetical protein